MAAMRRCRDSGMLAPAIAARPTIFVGATTGVMMGSSGIDPRGICGESKVQGKLWGIPHLRDIADAGMRLQTHPGHATKRPQ